MSNIEKLVDFINERDPSGKLFERFVAFLELGILARPLQEEQENDRRTENRA